MMKLQIAWSIVIVIAVISGCARMQPIEEIVTVSQVIDEPGIYDEQEISVSGYLSAVTNLHLMDSRESADGFKWDRGIMIYDASPDASLHLSRCTESNVTLVGTFRVLDTIGDTRVFSHNIRNVRRVTKAGERKPCWVHGFRHTLATLLGALQECRAERHDRTYRYRCQNLDLQQLVGLATSDLEVVLGQPDKTQGGRVLGWYFYDPDERIPFPEPTLECEVDGNGRCKDARWNWAKDCPNQALERSPGAAD